MKKFLTIVFFAIATTTFGQFNLNFYQMKGSVPQNNNINPSFFPQANVFVSLPVISGIDLSVNNSFSIKDVFTETGDSSLIDINRMLTSQEEGAYLNTKGRITDLMIGFRTGVNGFVTFFINEKFDGTVIYPYNLLNFIWDGNRPYTGQNRVFNEFGYGFTHYREIGVGYGRTFYIAGFDVNLGARLKYLNGMLHSRTSENPELNVFTSAEDYTVDINFTGGIIRNAGLDAIEDEDYGYFGFNSNKGFGLDLGANMDLSDRLNVGISVIDLGFINWSEYSEEVDFKGAGFQIKGSSYQNIDQLADAIVDSIDALAIDTVNAKFTTLLNSKVFLNGSYKVIEGGYLQATLANYFTQGTMKSAFGVGYTQMLKTWLAASATISAASQRGADLGVGLMLRGGFFQTYVSVDHILKSIDVPNATGVNFKFGINLLFGDPSRD